MKKVNRNVYIFRERASKVVPAFPAAWCVNYLPRQSTKQLYRSSVRAVEYAYTEDGRFFAVVDSLEDFNKFGDKLLKKFIDEPRYISGLITWSEKNLNLLHSKIHLLFPEARFKDLTNAQLAERYKQFAKIYQDFHLRNTPPWWIGVEAISRVLHERYPLSNGEFSILLRNPSVRSEIVREEVSLLQIAEMLHKNKIKRIQDNTVLPNRITRAIQSHVNTFESIPFGYNSGIVWPKSVFVKKLNKLLSITQPIKKYQSKRRHEIIQTRLDQQRLYKKYGVSKQDQLLFLALRQLGYLQELKKITQTRCHPYLQNVVKPYFSERLGIETKLFDVLSENEVANLFVTKGKDNIVVVNAIQRCVSGTLVMNAKGYHWMEKVENDNFLKTYFPTTDFRSTDTFTGVTANGGVSKGKVKICSSPLDSKKVRKGDILVTGMTTPDFILAMKRSSAIVTNEGGITCHASIVSRELKKPCIIGTKIATKVLKDGDLVEVDATKGVVRILKRAKHIQK